MNLYLTRHGETDWNAQHRVMGKADIELNATGIEQAKNILNELPKFKIDMIISSPLIRARQTAEILAQPIASKIILDDRISERDFGEFEGQNRSDFDFSGFWSYKNNYSYQRAENIRDFFARVNKFLDEIKHNHKDKNILLVTHGGTSIAIHSYFKGIPADDNLLSFGIGNCEIVNINK
jgi:broad specificity phosphatase PhoE